MQEQFATRGVSSIYKDLLESGPSHAKTFQVKVTLLDMVAVGCGPTKKMAKIEAAKEMLLILDGTRSSEIRARQPEAAGLPVSNIIGALGEYCVTNKMPLPSYKQEAMTGSDHCPVFTMSCQVGDWKTSGKGPNKQSAENQAAELMYKIAVQGGSSNSSSRTSSPSTKASGAECFSPRSKVSSDSTNAKHHELWSRSP